MPIPVAFIGKSLFTIQALIHLSIFTGTVESLNRVHKICGLVHKICGPVSPEHSDLMYIDFARNFRKVVCADEIDHLHFRISSGSGNFFGNPKNYFQNFQKTHKS
jgi:hypothetical protein